MIRNFIILFIVLCSSIYASGNAENLLRQKFNISEEAFNYLEETLMYLEMGSVNRKIIDWDSVRTQVYTKASNAITTKDTYEAIELAISLLQENHSFFQRPDIVAHLKNKRDDQAIDIIQKNSKLIHNHIGYLLIPSCCCYSKSAMEEYALSIQKEIQALDKNNLSKWIVDLRGNLGGNMWPMVLGLRPLIKSETFGFFSDGSGDYYSWNFDNFSVNIDNYEQCSLTEPSYELKQSTLQIAVLIDKQTISSGEATTIAFLGGDGIKIFGQRTGGYVSANEEILLSDGSAIYLATTYSADRLKRIYRESIIPDEITEVGNPTLDAAIQWLENSIL